MYTETLNPTPTNEKLMLLKGKREDLANIAITPGVIYFTTDYPGIYVDFAAEGTEGSDDYKAAKRVRMGDVTVIDSLDDLRDLTAESITSGQKLGKDTLYYAKDKNVLCIYDEGEGKFVWVNDTSGINQLATAIGTEDDPADAKTVYGHIAKETARAQSAEASLQQSIDEIKGISGDLETVQAQIDAMKGPGWDSANTIQGNANKINNEITNRQNAIETAEHNLKKYTDIEIEALRNDINDSFAAADAMTFKGGVGFKVGYEELDLPTINVKAGDTYVVKEEPSGPSYPYHAGDMMIAKYDQQWNGEFINDIQGSIINQDVIVDEVYTLKSNISIEYTEYINAFDSDDYSANELRPGQDQKYRVIRGCGYLKNNNNIIVPVLYTNSNPPPEAEPWPVDYHVPLYYEGQESINGTVYDKWRTIESTNSSFTWDSIEKKYTYTNIVVEPTAYPLENWEHIKTGYDQMHESKLSVLDEANNTIALTSHVGTPLGSVEFATTSPNLKIDKTSGLNGTINFNFVWATF